MFTKRGIQTRNRVFEFIRTWVEKNGYSPSIREIGKGAGISSTKAVKYHVDALVNSGVLRRRGRQARSLETSVQPFSLPLIGRIAAGQPLLAIENVEETVTLNRFKGCFMLRVRGDSMTGAGILDSDMVIVQPQESAQSGEIVVALLDTEATVKRLARQGEKVVLQPENARHEAIVVSPGERDFRIIGRVVGVLRNY